MSVLDNFGQWKSFLSDRLNHAEQQGMNHDSISNLATEIGGYLANHVEPKNEEEKILADLWKVADDNEKHAIANMMVKLVQNDSTK